MTARAADHDMARLVATLLSHHQSVRTAAPRALPDTGRRSTPHPALTGPTGLGTSAARIAAGRPAQDTSNTESTCASDADVPELYCPPPVRDDPALGEHVNDRLVEWAEEIGLYAGQIDHIRAVNVGRMMMLAHPDSDDPDRLLIAAKCALAEWATDDYYCDDGAVPEPLGARLGIAYTAFDPAHPPVRYLPEQEKVLCDDPVRVALRSAFEHLARVADGPQVARLRQEVAALFVAYAHEGTWRVQERMPTVWEYLAHRQFNSFLPCLALIDVVGGYRLSAAEYDDPRVRRVVTMAGNASTLVNDLYSMGKEDHDQGVEFNLPVVIAAHEQCSRPEAVKQSVEIHDELVRTFEAEAAALSLTGSPELRRFLAGVWSWLGGNREWHSGSARYNGT
ncbi:family 2 encapsulin nanocompartment cargo protein terpene cyclase [Streptomyces sp. NPDC058000]|uniref:family 2 encapsulin nanocompartment cargo protein terpene cyclase n=1 Tax=Streptomyces sp. NPDC058000 TaxID=3346299 RepID=UPI0036EE57A5